MKKILIGIFFCTGLFAANVVEGYGAAAAFIINQKNVAAMSQDERMQACENTIRSSGMDQTDRS